MVASTSVCATELTTLSSGRGVRLKIRLDGTSDASSSSPDASLGPVRTNNFSSDSEPDSDDDEPPAVSTPFGATLRNAARPGDAARGWHHAVPSAAHRALLHADARVLVNSAGVELPQTFWVDADEQHPTCSFERLALSVLSFHAAQPGGGGAAPMLGAEWWVQVRGSDWAQPSLGLHWDSDEDYKGEVGEHLPPWLATVTYLGDEGAPTLVLPIAGDAHARALPPKRGLGAFLSFPVAGKHLAFDGRLLHGAFHHMAARTSAEPFIRVTILVNLWCGHRPPALQRLPPAFAATLSNANVGGGLPAAMPVRATLSAAAEVPPPAATPKEGVDGWDKYKVGFIRQRKVVQQTPNWRELTQLGYPFRHPPLLLRQLPTAAAAADDEAPLSILRVPGVECACDLWRDRPEPSSPPPASCYGDAVPPPPLQMSSSSQLDELAARGLRLRPAVLSAAEQASLLNLVDEWLVAGKAGQLRGITYQRPPDRTGPAGQTAWTETGQGRECLLFGVRVKCNKVDSAEVEPLPAALEDLLDRLQAADIFPEAQRPDTCCVNVYEKGSWLPPHVDSDKFARPFFTLSLLSEQSVCFGPTVEGSRGEWSSEVRLALPTGSLLCVDGAAADEWRHALPCATERRVSLTFRRLGAEARAHLEGLREATLASTAARQERRRAAKEAKGRVPLDKAPREKVACA